MNMRVLIVDDELASSSPLKKMMEQRGSTVALATNLAGGLELALSFKPDVVVLDADLPDSKSFETMLAIKSFGAPVVVFSAFDEETLAIAAFKNGASDFIWKNGEANIPQRIAWAHMRNIYAHAP